MELVVLISVVAVVVIVFYVGRQSGRKQNGEVKLTITTEVRSPEVEPDDSDAWERGFWEAPDPKPVKAH